MLTNNNLYAKLEWLHSGWALFLSILTGAFIGAYFPLFFNNFKFISDSYLNVLKVITIPLILCAILLNIQTLFADKIYSKAGFRALMVLLFISFFAAVLGLFAGFIFQAGASISLDGLIKIDKIIGPEFVDQVTRINLFENEIYGNQSVIDMILEAIVPSNIFYSLAQGDIIKVAIFAIIFGFALTSVPSRLIEGFNQSLTAVVAACHKLSYFLSYLIPFVLMIISAGIASSVGADAIGVMSRFTITFAIASVLMVILSIWILMRRSDLSIKEVFIAIKPTLAISLTSAQYSTACIPQMVKVLHHNLGFSRERVELMVPLAATFVRSAPILFFSLAAVFISQIYNHDLSFADIFLILVLSIGQGFASLGLRGQQKLALLAVICNPLGIPNEAVLMLLLAIEPFCELLGGVTLVISQCASVAMVCNKPVRV